MACNLAEPPKLANLGQHPLSLRRNISVGRGSLEEIHRGRQRIASSDPRPIAE